MYDPINVKTISKADLVKEALNNKLYEGKTKQRKPLEENTSIYEVQMEREKINKQYADFAKKVKSDLLFECIYALYKPSLYNRTSPRGESLSKHLVKQFIDEQGVDKLLREFKNRSSFLCEVQSLVKNYSNIILERVDKNNPATYNIDTDIRDEFFDKLDTEDFESMSSIVSQRISSAMDDFIVDNIQTKAEIQEIVNQTKERIDTKKEITKESAQEYDYLGRSRIQNLKDSKRQSILNALVYNITESAIKDPNLNKIYFKNNKPDIDLIVDESVIVYSFLETVNSCKLDKVNEEYIKNFLDNFKYKR